MGRPKFREVEPEAEPRQGDGAEQDLWDHLRTLASRLANGQASGFATAIRDEAIRLDSIASPCSKRIESLTRFAIEHGARQRDVDGVVESGRKLTADGSWRAARDRHAEMRRRLSVAGV